MDLNLGAFEDDDPRWTLRYGIESILREIHHLNVERWCATGL